MTILSYQFNQCQVTFDAETATFHVTATYTATSARLSVQQLQSGLTPKLSEEDALMRSVQLKVPLKKHLTTLLAEDEIDLLYRQASGNSDEFLRISLQLFDGFMFLDSRDIPELISDVNSKSILEHCEAYLKIPECCAPLFASDDNFSGTEKLLAIAAEKHLFSNGIYADFQQQSKTATPTQLAEAAHFLYVTTEAFLQPKSALRQAIELKLLRTKTALRNFIQAPAASKRCQYPLV